MDYPKQMSKQIDYARGVANEAEEPTQDIHKGDTHEHNKQKERLRGMGARVKHLYVFLGMT